MAIRRLFADYGAKAVYYDSTNGRQVESYHTTMQGAVDAVETEGDGGAVWVNEGFDSGSETFPITISDQGMVIRGEANGTNLTGGIVNTSGNETFLVNSFGTNRVPGVTFMDLHMTGNDTGVGIDITDTRYCSVINCTAENFQTGFRTTNVSVNPNSNTFINARAHSCNGSGFYIDAGSHSTDLIGCRAVSNGNRGAWIDTSFACSVIGGQYELNDIGIYMDACDSVTVRDAYIENNTTSQLQMESDCFMVDSCYLNGGGNAATTAGIVCDGFKGNVRNIEFRNIDSGLIDIRSGMTDLDIDYHSIFSIDGDDIIEADSGTRTRYNGVIVEQDLDTAGFDDGLYVGDMGMHDGTGTTAEGPCYWDGTDWISIVDGSS